MVLLNILVSFIHFLGFYSILVIILVNTQMKYLLLCFACLILVKLLYIKFNRCLLTLIEENTYFATVISLTAKTIISIDLNDKYSEELVINIALLLIINKILLLIFLNH